MSPQIPDRVRKMTDAYESGASLRKVGRSHGVSGERVRQLFARHGYANRHRVTRERALAATVPRGTRKEIAQRLGVCRSSLPTIFARCELPLSSLVTPADLHKYTDDELLNHLRALAKKLGGRTPGKIDLDRHGPPTTTTYQAYVGSLSEAHRRAGLTPNRSRWASVALFGTDELRAELERRDEEYRA